jgi:hypothetical protein
MRSVRKNHPKLKDDSAFVFWFLQAFVSDSEKESLDAVTGVSGDKNMDAILLDEKGGQTGQAHIIQGKFRESLSHNEKRNDVLSFAHLSSYPWEDKRTLGSFYAKLDPLVKDKFEALVKKVGKKNGYDLKMYYITTGKCSKSIIDEAKWTVRQTEGNVDFFFLDGHHILTIFKDYLEGVAPAVPVLPLRIMSEGPVQTDGIIHRIDPVKNIESWVFSMSAKDVGEMYAKTGVRLFARNVRGYLGKNTEINEAIGDTIEHEPENFWYYNNGITIVCDDVRRETQGGQDFLYVDKPQIINGQQTTRTLDGASPTDGSVLVKVIKITRHPGDDEEYDKLVNSIVRATNWQNHIVASDLVSNDYIQVIIERSLRKLGYQYIRKKMTKSEAKRLFHSQVYFQIDKRELAQAVAATMFDPALVRGGREGLFEDPYYKSIFSSKSMSYYLSRYWLMKDIQYVSRGIPSRAYPKWVVLNFSWKLLSPIIGSGQGERRFRYANEQDDPRILRKLYRITDRIFTAALAFFREERGRGKAARDISTFFQLTKLDQRFAEYWDSPKNRYKKKVERALNEFREALERYELPE